MICPPEVEVVRTQASIEKAVGAWEATRVAACDLFLESEVMASEAPEPRTDSPPRLYALPRIVMLRWATKSSALSPSVSSKDQ